MLMGTHLYGFGVYGSSECNCTPNYVTTDRRGGSINITGVNSFTVFSGTFTGTSSNLINGDSTTANSTHSFNLTGAVAIGANDEFRVDFGAGASKLITEWKFYTSSAPTHGSWRAQGSNDASAWTNLGDTTWSNATQTFTLTNTQGFRYYRMLNVDSGKSYADTWYMEWQFKECNC